MYYIEDGRILVDGTTNVTPGILSIKSGEDSADFILTKNHIIIPSAYIHLKKSGFYFTSVFNDKSKGLLQKKKVHYIKYGDDTSTQQSQNTNLNEIARLFQIFTQIQIALDKEQNNG